MSSVSPSSSAPVNKQILLIEGCSSSGNFERKFVPAVKTHLSFSAIEAVRIVAKPTFSNEDGSLEEYYADSSADMPRLIGIGSCVQKIESGIFHALILLNFNTKEASELLVLGPLGSVVQAFVASGGVAVFPYGYLPPASSTSVRQSNLVDTLQLLFDCRWSLSSACRLSRDSDELKQFMPCVENGKNVIRNFGALVRPVWMKSDSVLDVNSVPLEERFFVGDNDSVSVAVRNVGNGAVAYIGDSSCSRDTIDLSAAVIMMRSPIDPLKSDKVEMSDEDFDQVLKLKGMGNDAFRDDNFKYAAKLYLDALCLYETYGTKFNPDYLEERLSLNALLSLCYVRLEFWYEAQTYAENVLSFNPDHEESILRLATAAVGLVRSEKAATKEWKISELKDAKSNLERVEHSPNPAVASEAKELLEKLEKMLNT